MSSTSQKTTNHLDSSQFTAMRAFIARRQDEIIDLICKLIEAESPSGDFEGSRKVVDLLVEAARATSAAIRRAPARHCCSVTPTRFIRAARCLVFIRLQPSPSGQLRFPVIRAPLRAIWPLAPSLEFDCARILLTL